MCLAGPWCTQGDLNIPKSSSEWGTSPWANAMQICCLLCQNMRKGIYVRRSASQNSFLARAFAPQSNVNWLQTQLADWGRTHIHTDAHKEVCELNPLVKHGWTHLTLTQHIHALPFGWMESVCVRACTGLSLRDWQVYTGDTVAARNVCPLW